MILFFILVLLTTQLSPLPRSRQFICIQYVSFLHFRNFLAHVFQVWAWPSFCHHFFCCHAEHVHFHHITYPFLGFSFACQSLLSSVSCWLRRPVTVLPATHCLITLLAVLPCRCYVSSVTYVVVRCLLCSFFMSFSSLISSVCLLTLLTAPLCV